MEIIGNDKKLRALFSEIRLEDGQAAPSFASTCQRAQSRSLQKPRALNFAFVAATALLVFGFASLAIWSKYSRSSETTYSAFASIAAGDFARKQTDNGTEAAVSVSAIKNTGAHSKLRSKNVVTQRAPVVARNRTTQQAAKEIASWQSPTASLLSSSSDDLFKSLPQLNENASELKSFLPNRSNDKEN